MPDLRRRQRFGNARQRFLQELASGYHHARQVPDPDFTQIDEPDAWRKIKRDPDIAASIEKSLTLTAGLDWEFSPASDRPQDKFAAQIMCSLAMEIRFFHEARKQLATGDFRGDAWAFVSGARKPFTVGDSATPRSWWVPREIRPVDRFRFRLVRTDAMRQDETITTDWQIGSVSRRDYSFLGENREAFIRHVHNPHEATFGYGEGLLESLFYFWKVKETIIAKQALAIRRWAAGFIEVEVDEAELSSEDADPADIVDKTLDELEIMRTEDALVHGKGQKYTIHDWPAQGGAMFREMYQILQNAIDRLILSSVLPTGGGGEVGSLSRAEEEGRQMDSTMQARSASLSESIDCGLGNLLWNRNREQIRLELDARSLPPARRPRFRIVRKAVDRPKDDLEILERAQRIGFPVTEKQVSEAGKIPIPASGEKVLTPPAPAAPAPPLEALPRNGDTHPTTRR